MSDATPRIVIVGGGTAGWMTAAALGRFCLPGMSITLVESDEIGIVGVGEATIPQIALFNQSLGIDEAEFLAATGGTFKLGIEFDGWGKPDEALRPRLRPGRKRARGGAVPPLLAARARSSASPRRSAITSCTRSRSPAIASRMSSGRRAASLPPLPYAYHFDASLYAKFLRGFAEKLGVVRAGRQDRRGRAQRRKRRRRRGPARQRHPRRRRPLHRLLGLPRPAHRARTRGRVRGLDGVAAVRPRDRGARAPGVEPLMPLTRGRSRARPAGSGASRCSTASATATSFQSRRMSEDEAAAILLANLDGEALAEPRTIRFMPGIRRKSWVRNVVAIGLSSGFIEPLESTSIHVIQTAINRLIELLPGGEVSDATRDDFNDAHASRDGAHPRLHHPPLPRQPARRMSPSGTISGRWRSRKRCSTRSTSSARPRGSARGRWR